MEGGGGCSKGRRSSLQTTWLAKALSKDTLQNDNLQHVTPGSALLHGGEASVSAVLKLAELQRGPASTDKPQYRQAGPTCSWHSEADYASTIFRTEWALCFLTLQCWSIEIEVL